MSARAELMTALGAARDAADDLPPHAFVTTLREQVDAAVKNASSSGAPREHTLAALGAAAQTSMLLAVEAPATAPLVAFIGAALNAAIALARRADFAGTPAPISKRLIAAHRAPRARAVERSVFRWRPIDVSTEPSPLDLGSTDGGEGDASSELVAANDSDLFDPEEAAPPPVVRIEGRGAPIALGVFYDRVIDAALETAALLERDRHRMPYAARSELEPRLLRRVDALAAVGGGVASDIVKRWQRRGEDASPFDGYASTLALATMLGGDALLAVDAGIEALPRDAASHAAPIAEALDVSTHPDVDAFALHLAGAPHPVARAVSLELRSRRAALGSEDVACALVDPNLPVLLAALRAAARLGEDPRLSPIVVRWLDYPNVDVARAAAWTVTSWGRDDAIEMVRAREAFAARLGITALQLLVLRGDDADRALFAKLGARLPRSRGLFDACARFGDARAAAFLIGALSDDDLAEDAASALELLFGALVEQQHRLVAATWRGAVRDARLDPMQRLRRGALWKPSALADDIARGRGARSTIEADVAELRARCGLASNFDGAAYEPHAREMVAELVTEARALDARFPAGTWRITRRA